MRRFLMVPLKIPSRCADEWCLLKMRVVEYYVQESRHKLYVDYSKHKYSDFLAPGGLGQVPQPPSLHRHPKTNRNEAGENFLSVLV
eukprot:SAG31_NODE_5757_length_2342_cov_0.963442_2_plen_86_part_00